MATRNIVPRATGEGGIGTEAKKWALGWINALVVASIKITTGAGANKVLTSDADGDATWETPSAAVTFASAAEQLAGAVTDKASSPSVSREMVLNLKPVVNGDVNKLDIFSKSGGAVPDATNPIKIMIPDGNGYTQRVRAAAVASGTGQIIMADAANYWSKGSLDAEIKTAYLYAIWSTADGGIVFALNGYSGFTRCPASVTATDDDYMHLEASSSYTPVITDYCIVIAKIRYQYDTADAPDHTIQATVLDAPQVVWNPKSDYGYSGSLAARITSASNISDDTRIMIIVKQSGKYFGVGKGTVYCSGGTMNSNMHLRMGNTAYASATEIGLAQANSAGAFWTTTSATGEMYLNAGDAIHFGIALNGASGNRIIEGDDNQPEATTLYFKRSD
uniref:Uncharacterized protein n=1 Tax=viral metagenome TaxID=1070528 RepID=A0A6M3KQR5_9ZZZZ